jgi:transcriptional regulator NrdR family protein
MPYNWISSWHWLIFKYLKKVFEKWSLSPTLFIQKLVDRENWKQFHLSNFKLFGRKQRKRRKCRKCRKRWNFTRALSDVCLAESVGPAGKRFPFDRRMSVDHLTAESTSMSNLFWPTTKVEKLNKLKIKIMSVLLFKQWSTLNWHFVCATLLK